jgi:hypothetical protein
VAKTYDATLKGMLETSPASWVELAGYGEAQVSVVDADVSTFTGAADKVLRVHDNPGWLMHLEFQASRDASLSSRMHVYNSLLDKRHGLLVRSVAVILRPVADMPSLTGVYEREFAGSEPHVRFLYQILRVWQVPVKRLLEGGLGTLPLAPISAVKEGELLAVIAQMKDRIESGRQRSATRKLWTAAYVLMGLRYSETLTDQLLQEVISMEESVTYQAIVRRGKREEARKLILLMGRNRFGRVSAEVRDALNAIQDIEKLEDLGVRLLDVSSWQELLGLSEPPPRSRSRKQST